jgi:oligopeptide/dipeptide ABC transporter ATP-binding protein
MADALGPPVLSVRDLGAHFESVQGIIPALAGISLDLTAGRVLGVVGKSGCGKSVTARAILQLIDRPGRIVGGRIVLNPCTPHEDDILRLAPGGARMRQIRGGGVGLIFQEPMAALNMHYTVGNQIIKSVRRHRGLFSAAAREAAIELLRDVGISRPELRIDAYAFELSGGRRQRVGIAMALDGDPDIIIADEPVSALNVSVQAQIINLLLDLQDRPALAMLFVAHDLSVVKHVSDRVAVMYAGRIVEVAPTKKHYAMPRHPHTEALLAAVPKPEARFRGSRLPPRGAVADPMNLPASCSYHPRCAYAVERCRQEAPTLLALEDGRFSACHRAGEIVLAEIA